MSLRMQHCTDEAASFWNSNLLAPGHIKAQEEDRSDLSDCIYADAVLDSLALSAEGI